MDIFKDNLKQSEMYEELLNNFYSKVVKDFKKIKTIKFEGKGINFQLSSCDKVILLKNGKKVLIEEKLRFKTYNIADMFLEEISNTNTNKIGWIKKETKSKYLVYYIVPTNTIYIVNFKKIQKVYKEKRQEWLSYYCWTYAKNKGYETKGICVPIEELEKYLKIKKYKL